MNMNDLSKKSCQSCEGIGSRFTQNEINEHLIKVHKNWNHDKKNRCITRHLHFKNHFEVVAFVNAVAWISHSENHHPSMVIHYANCEISYSTHALDGLTENDFICASKVDALLQQQL